MTHPTFYSVLRAAASETTAQGRKATRGALEAMRKSEGYVNIADFTNTVKHSSFVERAILVEEDSLRVVFQPYGTHGRIEFDTVVGYGKVLMAGVAGVLDILDESAKR